MKTVAGVDFKTKILRDRYLAVTKYFQVSKGGISTSLCTLINLV